MVGVCQTHLGMSTHPSKKSLLTTGVGKRPARRQEVWRPSSTTRGIWCIKRVATSGASPLRQILWISWWTGPAKEGNLDGKCWEILKVEVWRSEICGASWQRYSGSKFSYITSLLYIYTYNIYIYMHPKYFLTRYESLKSPKTFPQKVRLGPWGKASVNGTWKVDRWISFLGSRLWNIRREYGGWLSHGGTPSYSFIDGFSLINHQFLAIPIYRNLHLANYIATFYSDPKHCQFLVRDV